MHFNFYIFCYSIWLRDKPGGGPAQQIGMLDTVPDEETVDIPKGATASDTFFVQVIIRKTCPCYIVRSYTPINPTFVQ